MVVARHCYKNNNFDNLNARIGLLWDSAHLKQSILVCSIAKAKH
jgi:hypothetical protein